MMPARQKRERGAALLALLAVIMLGASWFLVSQLNAESGGRAAINQIRNAEVLNRAKQSLIGYVAALAAEAGETNPGRLSCPEPPGNIGGTNEGVAAGNCTLPAVGRFPWRTFGTDKLVDVAGEPLWYVVSPAWALSNSTSPALTTYINSNSMGQLLVNARTVSTLSHAAGLATAVSVAHGFNTGDIVKFAGAAPTGYNVAASVTVIDANTFTFAVDSTLSSSATGTIKVGNAAVALIVAPGQAMNVAASTDCAARNQVRSIPSPTISSLDYLECYDAANGVFTTIGPAASFNDQTISITVADIMPAIEAAIANRIEREIVPALQAVFSSSAWGFSGSNPIFPFAAPFANPGTSGYQGVAGTYEGLLPFNQTQGCDPSTEPRCSTTLTAWASPSPASPPDVTKVGGYGSFQTKTCSWQSGGEDAYCEGEFLEDSSNPSGSGMVISMTATINNVAMGLRLLDATKATIEAEDDYLTGSLTTITPSVTAVMNNDGSATVTVSGTLPNIDDKGWGSYANYRIRLQRSVIGDHALLSSSDATTGWFVRNEWYRLAYYALTQSYTAAAINSVPSSCTVASPACLSVTNVSGSQRAILILTGRSVNGTARPSSTLADYLEFGNAAAAFERLPVSVGVNAALKKPFNDRIVVVGSN